MQSRFKFDLKTLVVVLLLSLASIPAVCQTSASTVQNSTKDGKFSSATQTVIRT